MAICKILHMKDSGPYHGRHLDQALKYILKEEKTQECRLAGAINCQLANAFEQMRATKQKFGKLDKRQGYHLIISFSEGEIDGDRAFKFLQRFAAEYLGEKYEAVYSVHDNTDHIHGHIIFNSVSFLDGRKFRYEKGDWAREIQPLVNRLCEEYGLSTIEIEDDPRAHKEYQSFNDYRDGNFVWSDMVRRDLDACIVQAKDYEEFLKLLQEKGYEIKNAHGEGKYFSIKPQGMYRFKRCKSLGQEYEEERIKQRILEEELGPPTPIDRKSRIVYCKVKRYKRAKLSGMQKKYYRKLYQTSRLKKRAYSQAWQYRDEIKKMQKLQDQYLFLVKHNINSMEELLLVENALADKKKECGKERSRIYKARAKCNSLFDIAKEMSDYAEAEECFLDGDSYFKDEHECWEKLASKLKAQGYSYDEVLKLKEYYRSAYAKHLESYTAVSRELRVAKSIREDYLSAGTEQAYTEERKIIPIREKSQPIR